MFERVFNNKQPIRAESGDGPKNNRGKGVRAVALAAALFAALPGERDAVAAELSPKLTWEEGLQVFREYAERADVEHQAFFVIDRNGNTQWSSTKESTYDPQKGHIISQDGGEVRLLVNETTQELRAVHTHPKTLIQKELKSDTAPATSEDVYSKPPSVSDLIYDIRMHFQMEQRDVVYRSTVVDPSGAWHVTVEDAHAVPDTLNDYFNAYNALKEIIRATLSDTDDEDLLRQATRKCMGMALKEIVTTYGKKASRLVSELEAYDGRLNQLGAFFVYNSYQNNHEEEAQKDQSRAQEKIIAAAARDGILLSFEQHTER